MRLDFPLPLPTPPEGPSLDAVVRGVEGIISSLKAAHSLQDPFLNTQKVTGDGYTNGSQLVLISPAAAVALVFRSVDIINNPSVPFFFKDAAGTAATWNITVSTEGSELIDGAATKVISTNYGKFGLVSDGFNLFSIW